MVLVQLLQQPTPPLQRTGTYSTGSYGTRNSLPELFLPEIRGNLDVVFDFLPRKTNALIVVMSDDLESIVY